MSEPVNVDGIPVELSPARQKRWDAGEQDAVADEIRALREKHVDHPAAPDTEPPASYDDVLAEHGITEGDA